MPSVTNVSGTIRNDGGTCYIGTFLVRYGYEPDDSVYAALYLQNPQHTFMLSKTKIKAMDIYEKLSKPTVVDLYEYSPTTTVKQCPGLDPVVIEVNEIYYTTGNGKNVPTRLRSSPKNIHMVINDESRTEDKLMYVTDDNRMSYIMAFPEDSFVTMDDTTDEIRLLLRFIGAPVSYTSQRFNAVLLLMLHLPHSEKFLMRHMKDVFQRDGVNYRLLRSKLEIVKMTRSRWYYLMKMIHDNVQFDVNKLRKQNILNNVAKNVLLEREFRLNPMGDMLFLFTILQKQRSLLIGGCFEGIMYSASMEYRIKRFLNHTKTTEYQDLYEVAFTKQESGRWRR